MTNEAPGTRQRLRVACVIGSMGAGGAERVMAQLCNHLAARGHDVTLLTLSASSDVSFYDLSNDVRLAPLGRVVEGEGPGRLLRAGAWVVGLRRAFKQMQPDVVISFIDLVNVMTLLAARGLGIPIIAGERIDPHFHRNRASGVERWLCRAVYPRANRIVVQTSRAAAFFSELPSSQVVIIPNPVPAATQSARPDVPGADGRFRVIAVGRLDPQKGFDLLIEAFAMLAAQFPRWDVVVFGQGPERTPLSARIANLGLNDRVTLAGVTKDIGGEYARSHVMAFSSRYEGFPNALAEAMAAGLPPVAFEGVSGVEDLIVPDKAGVLVSAGNAHSFAAGLERLMESAPLRSTLGTAAKASVRAFDPATMFARWDELIAAVVSGSAVQR